MSAGCMKKGNREAGQESRGILFLYGTIAGRCLLKFLICPEFSKIIGKYLDSSLSRWMIPVFIKRHRIAMQDFEEVPYNSFNHFFIRKRKAEGQMIDDIPKHLISPCDGYLSIYPIDESRTFWIKNIEYNLRGLLQNELLADAFQDGICLIFRLTPQHYHRYCYIDDGRKGKNTYIKGTLHCVRPIAYETYPVYAGNSREYTLIHTEHFGRIVQMEIGAMLVGKIHNHHERKPVCRGEEKGYFEFGGSTIVLLFEKDKIQVDEKIMMNMRSGRETEVRMGERIGEQLVLSYSSS